MKLKVWILVCCVFLFIQAACAQIPQANTVEVDDNTLRKRIKTQAEPLGQALMTGDIAKILDLMHPKMRASIPDEAKFIDDAQKWFNEQKAVGIKPLAVEIDEPKEVLKLDNRMFAVLPTKLRVELPTGTFVKESFEIAVSDDAGKTWKFIGVQGGNGKDKFKQLFPEADKLELPEDKPAVKYQ